MANQPPASRHKTATPAASIMAGRLRDAATAVVAAAVAARGMTTVAGAAPAPAGVADRIFRHAAIDLRAVGGAHGEAGIDAGEQRSRERKPAVGEGHVSVVDDPIDRVGRRTAGDRVMDRGSQGVDIRPRSLRGGRELLDRGVARGEDRRHRLRPSGYCGAGGAEIDQHGVTVAIDQDIGGFDIAMQEAHLVDLLRPQ